MSFHFSSLYCSSYFPAPTDLERNKSASMKAKQGRTSSHFCREPTQMSSLPQESGVTLHHRSLPALRMTSAARRKAMGIGGGAVLFFADDGDGLAGASLTVAASSTTCLRSAMVVSAQLPPLPPSWMPWCCLSCSLRTKFCCVCIFWAWSGWSSSSSQNLRVGFAV